MSVTLQRVLGHIREVHDSLLVPLDFIDRFRLRQCGSCKKWFQKLAQHAKKCSTSKRKSAISNVHEVDTCHQSDECGAVSSSGRKSEDICTNSVDMDCVDDLHFEFGKESHREEAWSFIRDMSADDIVNAPLPRITQSIAPSLKSLFQECCLLAMHQILLDPQDDVGWKLFLAIPRMILRYARGGSSAVRRNRTIYQDFINFRWDSMLRFQWSEKKSPSKKSSDFTKRQKAAVRLVKKGELSRAAKLLTSPDLAPVSSDTAAKLKQ